MPSTALFRHSILSSVLEYNIVEGKIRTDVAKYEGSGSKISARA